MPSIEDNLLAAPPKWWWEVHWRGRVTSDVGYEIIRADHAERAKREFERHNPHREVTKMRKMKQSATYQAIADTARVMWRWALPAAGAFFLLTAILHGLGGPCLLPGSIACSF